MRFFLLLTLVIVGPARPITVFADSLASPGGSAIAPSEINPVTPSQPFCSMGSTCSHNSSMNSDWADQLSDLDLMRDEMSKLKPDLVAHEVKVSLIDTGASKSLNDDPTKGKIDYTSTGPDSDKLGPLPLGMSLGDLINQLPPSKQIEAWDDYPQHGTAVSALIRRLSSGNVEVVPTSGRTRMSAEELNRLVEIACSKSRIVNVSWHADKGDTFNNCHSLQQRMLDKGCLVLIAAGNSGGENKDCFTSIGAIDQSGNLPKFATKGDLYAAGDRVPVEMKIRPSALPQCNKETFLVSGSSVAAPQATAVAKNVMDILMQTGEFRERLEPRKQAQLVDQILRQSAVNHRIDGYRAVKLAEKCAKLDGIDQCLENLRFQAHLTWRAMQSNTHNPGNCASKSDCGARMTCYKDKRRWLAGLPRSSTAARDAVKDLFVTAQNSGDSELAANWAAQLKAANANFPSSK